MKKSKKSRRKWWKSLNSDEKARFIDKKVAAKAEYRIKRTKRWLRDTNLEFDCSVCIHHLSGSCEDESQLPRGCEYWENLIARESVSKKLLPYWVH